MDVARFDRLYRSAPDGSGGVTLTLRRPVLQTRDARTVDPPLPLMRPGDRVRMASRRERGTRDELLTPMTSGQTISRGKLWPAGAGADPELDAALSPVIDFVRGFVPDNVVGAVDLAGVISLGRVFLPQAPEELRESLSQALDDAQAAWEAVAQPGRDEETRPLPGMEPGHGRSFNPYTQGGEARRYRQPGDDPLQPGLNPSADVACDVPVEPGSRMDGKPSSTRDQRGGSGLFASARRQVERYASGLPEKRAALTQDKSPPTAKPRMSSAEFASLRKGKGA
jgi:hypothetical protein